MIYHIYAIIPVLSGLPYIGATKNTQQRIFDHLAKRALPIECGYTYIFLACCRSKADADWAEKYLVDHFQTNQSMYGHNRRGGGFQKYVLNESHKKAVALAMAGNTFWHGRKHSPETKAKIKATKAAQKAAGFKRKSRAHNPETYAKIAATKKAHGSYEKAALKGWETRRAKAALENDN